MAEGFEFVNEASPVQFDRIVPWERGCEKLFVANQTTGVGRGELAIAAMLLNLNVTDPESASLQKVLSTVISGQGKSFDVNITEKHVATIRSQFGAEAANWQPHQHHFGKTEVKDPYSESNGTVTWSIRLGTDGMRAVVKKSGFLLEIGVAIENAVNSMTEYLELTLPSEDFTALKTFRDSDVPDIQRFTISIGRILGEVQPGGQKFGLFQAAKKLALLKKAKLDIKSGRYKIKMYSDIDRSKKAFNSATPEVMVACMEAQKLTEPKMRKQLSDLGFHNVQIDLMLYLKHEVFSDPDLIIQQFKEFAHPRDTLGDIDRLGLARPTCVKFITREQFTWDNFTFTGTCLGGRPNYRVDPVTLSAV